MAKPMGKTVMLNPLTGRSDNVFSFSFAGNKSRRAFPRVFINNIQYLESFAILCVVNHEIITPNTIIVLRPESGTGTIVKL